MITYISLTLTVTCTGNYIYIGQK